MNKILLFILLIISTKTFGQTIKQDSIISSELNPVSIVGEKARSLPGSGQYIGYRKLEKLNQTNINSVMRLIPGVNIRDEEGYGLRPNIGLRGTPVNRSAKITLMEDGILIAPAPYADPSAYYFPTFARMQGVEVLKGSSQIKYGPYTIGGAVNLISTQIPKSFKGHSQLSYGSFGTNQQRIWIGDSRKNIDYVFEVNRLASKGFKQLDNGGNTGFDRRDIMGKVRWHTDINAKVPQSLTLKFVNSSELGNETYLGLTYEDYKVNHLRRYAATQKDALDMNHNHITLNHTINPLEGLSIATTAYYSNTFRNWARVNTIGGQSLLTILGDPMTYQLPYLIMTGAADGTMDYQSAARTYFSQGVQTNARYSFNTKGITHNIQVGARYHIDQADRYATSSAYAMTNGTMILTAVGVQGNQENQIRNANGVATYLSYDLSFKSLKVSPGVRYENMNFELKNYGTSDVGRLGNYLKSASNQLSVLLPGIGFNYDLNKQLNFFGGVHKGFSPPGMPSVTSNTGQAKVETSVNYELGCRYEGHGLNAQLSGFLNSYENIIGSDNVSGGGAGSGDLFNAGHARIQGVEFSVNYDLLHKKNKNSDVKLPIGIVYTFTQARFLETFKNGGGDWGSGVITKGDLIPFITPHLLTGSVAFENKKFNVTLIGRYTGETRIKPGQGNSIVPANNVKFNDVNAIKSFLLLDLSANYKFGNYLTLFSTLTNLTNNKSIVANLPQGYRPAMPFGLNLGVKSDF